MSINLYMKYNWLGLELCLFQWSSERFCLVFFESAEVFWSESPEVLVDHLKKREKKKTQSFKVGSSINKFNGPTQL